MEYSSKANKKCFEIKIDFIVVKLPKLYYLVITKLLHFAETVLAVTPQLGKLHGFSNSSSAVCQTSMWAICGVILLSKTQMNYFGLYYFKIIVISIIWLILMVILRKVCFCDKEVQQVIFIKTLVKLHTINLMVSESNMLMCWLRKDPNNDINDYQLRHHHMCL